MYINGQRPHKQAKYTQTKYHTIWSKFRTKVVHTKKVLKMEGEILKLKKWGEDEGTNTMHKIKT